MSGETGRNGDVNGSTADVSTNGGTGCPFLNGGSNEPTSRYASRPFVLKNLLEGSTMTDTLHQKAVGTVPCDQKTCLGSIYMPSNDDVPPGEMRPKEEVKKHATVFLNEYYTSLKKQNSESHVQRLKQVISEIDQTSTYELDIKELEFGARLAWRNAPRCNGRIQWKKLTLFDCRHVETASDMFGCITRHIQYATNKGNLRSTITIFPHKKSAMSEYRVWNSQLVRYAGYRQKDGTVIGDPASVELTEVCKKLGWKGYGGHFDIIPMVLSAPGQPPELFEIPKDIVLEVPITHPHYPIDKLGLKWYAIPAVANMMLDIGGLQFTACPFSGWYNATEIGARNFTDTCRYNLMKPAAELCGFDTSNMATLWKDKIAVELTVAVIHSFQKSGVTIVDHHSSAETFMKHIKDEEKLRGGCPTDWVWVVPPLTGGIMPMFHQEFLNYKLRPSYEYQPDPWKYLPNAKLQNENESEGKGYPKRRFKDVVKAVKFSSSMMSRAMEKRSKATILYATETGKSEKFANTLNEILLFAFDSKVVCMEDYDVSDLPHEQCVIIVTSTFGNGESPDNGRSFQDGLEAMIAETASSSLSTESLEILTNVRFAVFGLGSRAYPNFCSFAHIVKRLLKSLGGEEIHETGEGDELCGQESSFNEWAAGAFKAACDSFGIYDVDMKAAISSIASSAKDWKKGLFRLSKTPVGNESIPEALSKLHRKKVVPAKCISVQNLQSSQSDRVTNLVKIDRCGHDEIMYKAGDHLSVYPTNEKVLVDALLDRVICDVGYDDCVTMEIKEVDKWVQSNKIPFVTTLRQMITSYLDITSPPSPKLLAVFSEEATNEEEKYELELLSTDNDKYEDWSHANYPNIVEVLEKFKSVACDVTMLINHLPLLNPRHYSISSSQDLHPSEVHVTVALVSYEIKGNTHNGVCSYYLSNLKPNDVVYCNIRKASSFYLPTDRSSPVIMIGPGTGIAPFRSFWQQALFEHTENKDSVKRDMTLYFGCRNSKHDDIYAKETTELVNQKILSSVRTAYSREENLPKTYVQQILHQDMEKVGETILDKQGHVYVCGDVTMASDVSKMITKILQEYAALSDEEAKQFISELRTSKRYHEDIFGVTLKVKEVTEKVRKGSKRLRKQKTLTKQLTLNS
eukprot:TCONS_00049205-protein